jgi:hypothetical protein
MTVKPQEKPLGYCLDCDYSLQGLTTNRCPECGREFDPADPRTRNTETPIGNVGRFFMKPIGWSMPALAVLYILMCCWETRVPIGPVKFPFASRYVAAFLWVLWMVRMMGRLAFRMRHMETNIVSPGGWRLAWLVPFLIVVAMSLVGWGIPVQLGFSISRTPMQNLADQVIAAPTAHYVDRWVGVYKTKGIGPLPEGYRGARIAVAPTGDAPAGVHCGFAYCPDDTLPPHLGRENYEPLVEHWYTWQTDTR